MTNPKDTAGKRWWEKSFKENFPIDVGIKDLGCFIAHVEDKSYENGLKIGNKNCKFRQSLVEEQAFRKGVEASLGALPELGSTVSMHALRYREKAKENIGKLLK